MPPSFSVEPDSAAQRALLGIARDALRTGLTSARPLQIDLDAHPPSFAVACAVFVTLTRDGALRGCVGSLEAREPLVQAVATSAYNAAFRDRRFRAPDASEIESLRIEISLLSEMSPVSARERSQLIETLEPGIDGLLIEDGAYRATFLPKVWEKLPAPDEFVAQLMQKAGLPERHWSASTRCFRYRCLSFAED